MKFEYKNKARILLFITAIVVAAVTELLSKRSLVKGLLFIASKPHIFLLNAGIVFSTYALLLLVKRKRFFAVLITAIWLILGIVNFVLLSFRVTPFNFSDLRLTKDAMLVAGKYLTVMSVILLAAGVVLFVVLLVFLFVKLPPRDRHAKVHRIRGLVLAAMSFFAMIGIASLFTRYGMIEETFGNLAEAYQEYGFIYCFTNSMLNMGVKKPGNYDETVVEEISSDELTEEKEVDTITLMEIEPDIVDETGIAATEETPNIIFLQLESFSDPMLYTHCQVSKDPIPNFRKLREKYSSGYLSVPSVGAGTANTEFESITGMNLDFFGPGEYPYKTILQKEICESMGYNLKELGYHTHAIHNNSATFYDRHSVFSRLGFETFTALEYMRDYEKNPIGWAKDKILVSEIEKVLNSTQGADYIYTISVQGHGAYPTEPMVSSDSYFVTGLETPEEENQMNYYISQIHEMDDFVADLVEALSQRKEPIILVMYGDHLPSLSLTADRLANGNEFQTEYVIWDNFGLPRYEKDLEAYQMGAYIQKLAGLSIGTMFRYHQSYMEQSEHAEEEQEAYLNDMQVLEYDLLYGKKEIYGGECPYEETNLHYGVSEISLSSAVVSGDGLYLFGKGFTENSRILLNGEPLETSKSTANMICSEQYSFVNGINRLSVVQISDDNITLSATNELVLTNYSNATND